MAQGKITRLVKDRGFGFVQASGSNEDIFFHSTSLTAAGTFDGLREGQAVEFDKEPDPRNPSRSRAANVRVID